MTAPVVTPIDLPHRKVAEWVGSSPDAKPPRAVIARIFRRYDGRCYLSGEKIGVADVWELEHIKPLWQAQPGENLNRESNMAPALKKPHAEKTAAEATDRNKADRIHAKHFGYWPESKSKIRGGSFQGSRPPVERRDA